MTDNDNNNDPFFIDKAVVPTLILTEDEDRIRGGYVHFKHDNSNGRK